jgi:nicotinamidase-related amidase
MGQRSIPLSLNEILAPSHSTLVVWDMQQGLGGHVFNLDDVVARISKLIGAARAAGVPVVWSRHILPPIEFASAPSVRDFMRRQRVERPEDLAPFMQDGSDEVGFVDGLRPEADDLVIDKSTRSFFVGTPADLRLRDLSISTLVLTGASTDQGIEVTARHAFALGYFPVVVEDAVSSRSAGAHELGLTFLRAAQTDVVPLDVVLRVWAAAR